VLEVFAPVQRRPRRGSYTGYGKRLPSDKPPVVSPKELASLTAANGQNGTVNGQQPALGSDDQVTDGGA
jgi:cell division protease FtsH